MTQLLTVGELARHMRVHPETVRRWYRNPPISFVFPTPIRLGHQLRWRPEDVMAAELQSTGKPQAAGGSNE